MRRFALAIPLLALTLAAPAFADIPPEPRSKCGCSTPGLARADALSALLLGGAALLAARRRRA